MGIGNAFNYLILNMSLGTLGQYGSESGSSISDSDECDGDGEPRTVGPSPANKNSCVADPLSLGLEGAASGEDSSDSDSTSDSSSLPPSLDPQAVPSPLPLPDIDGVVARNASYANSELVTSRSAVEGGCGHPQQEAESGESSVFFNPYKKAEEAKLAILKKHVSEFSEKPDVGDRRKASRRGRFRASSRSGHSRVEIPPPVMYAKHAGDLSRFGGPGPGFPPAAPPPTTHIPIRHPGRPMHCPPHSHRSHPGHEEWGEGGMRGANLFDDKDSSNLVKRPRKHRSGVGDSLTPPKKFMKLHQQIRARERPWTLDQ